LLAEALLVLGALRFDVLVARWRQLFGAQPAVREPPPEHGHPPAAGLKPHDSRVQKPSIHRSGKRH
jgi:hypothetical protein